jgi:hypothetical protein
MKVARNYFLNTDRLGFGHWSKGDQDLAMMLWANPK